MRRWNDMRGDTCPDCRWLSERLGYYLEGALGSRAMVRANSHLDECPSCQRSASVLEDALKAARELRWTAQGYDARDFEESVWEKIRISREIQRQPSFWTAVRSPRVAWWGGGVAAVSAAAMITVYLMSEPAPSSDQAASWSESSVPSGFVLPSAEITTTSVPVLAGTMREATGRSEPSSGFVASAPQAGDETAPPAGPEATVASTQGPGRLEPGAQGDELYLEDIQTVPDPWTAYRSYVVRQAVVARPGTGRISF